MFSLLSCNHVTPWKITFGGSVLLFANILKLYYITIQIRVKKITTI